MAAALEFKGKPQDSFSPQSRARVQGRREGHGVGGRGGSLLGKD